MSIKPIPFNTEMVRAILTEKKTQEIILEYAKERRKFLKWYHKNKKRCEG